MSRHGIWTWFSACEEGSKPILVFPVVVWVFQRARGQAEHLQTSGGWQDHGIILGRGLSLERPAACSMDYGINWTIKLAQTLVLQVSNPGHVQGPLRCVFCINHQMLKMQDPSYVCVLGGEEWSELGIGID